MKTYYHATAYENLGSILMNGLKASKYDGLVYLCEKPEDAIKFLYVRGIRNIVTFEINVPKRYENKVIETFDHSYEFFKCRAFGFKGDIPVEMIEPHAKYNL